MSWYGCFVVVFGVSKRYGFVYLEERGFVCFFYRGKRFVLRVWVSFELVKLCTRGVILLNRFDLDVVLLVVWVFLIYCIELRRRCGCFFFFRLSWSYGTVSLRVLWSSIDFGVCRLEWFKFGGWMRRDDWVIEVIFGGFEGLISFFFFVFGKRFLVRIVFDVWFIYKDCLVSCIFVGIRIVIFEVEFVGKVDRWSILVECFGLWDLVGGWLGRCTLGIDGLLEEGRREF